jgi:flavin reductase (DIM6/NTAB) family NADH-FMN oxidoreductase RutF
MSWLDQRPDDATAGAFTTEPPEIIPTVDARVFREAMARLGAAVHVITTAGVGGTTGFTATAVCSVSDQPPTLLVCVNRGANSGHIVARNGVFCVNTLRAGQERIADLFAKRASAKTDAFAADEWITLANGCPVLAASVVAFDCRVTDLKPVASHNVIFGAVQAVRHGPIGPALVYHDRAYKQV